MERLGPDLTREVLPWLFVGRRSGWGCREAGEGFQAGVGPVDGGPGRVFPGTEGEQPIGAVLGMGGVGFDGGPGGPVSVEEPDGVIAGGFDQRAAGSGPEDATEEQAQQQPVARR